MRGSGKYGGDSSPMSRAGVWAALAATLATPASAAPAVHNLGIVNGRAT